MTNREALERIKRSHYVAMSMLCDGRKDKETENAIKVIEQALKRLDDLEKFVELMKKELVLSNCERIRQENGPRLFIFAHIFKLEDCKLIEETLNYNGFLEY